MPLISGVVRWLKAENRIPATRTDVELIDVLRRDLGLGRSIDHDGARRNDGARQFGRCGPAAETARKDKSDDGASQQVPPDRPHFVAVVRGDHGLDAGLGDNLELRRRRVARRSTRYSTSSFGPNACWAPRAIARTRSTAASALGRWAPITTMPPRANSENSIGQRLFTFGIKIGIWFVEDDQEWICRRARANAMRCCWPADSAARCSPIGMS